MSENSRTTLTVTESGHALTETQAGITMPADYSFATVNDYVHGVDVDFESLVALCLGMSNHIDKLTNSDVVCCKCGRRTACTYPVSHDNG